MLSGALQRARLSSEMWPEGVGAKDVHQLHPACGDGLGHHAAILPGLVAGSGVQVDSFVAHRVSRAHVAADLLFLRVLLVSIGRRSTAR
ncbi:hypothetical protein [Micromonospora sp. DT47]|uniref:hypothetical protein n=1 Tax=Micromonospora sp. DT47 TaxID=3393431 RepID=UPI003CF7A45E